MRWNGKQHFFTVTVEHSRPLIGLLCRFSHDVPKIYTTKLFWMAWHWKPATSGQLWDASVLWQFVIVKKKQIGVTSRCVYPLIDDEYRHNIVKGRSTTDQADLVPRVLALPQPRSQGLSSLPSLIVGRKTLVAAGHVTTQNLDGKKICWLGGVAECFVWLMWQTLWISSPLAVTYNHSLYRGSKSNLPMMLHNFCRLQNRRLSFTKKFGSRMEQKLFDG